jgi:hypothetical protein
LPQAQQELIGMDLSQPLPFERTSAPQPRESAAAAVEAGTLSAEDANVLTRATLTERDIEVDQIASLELEPELLAGLNLDEGAEVEFGDSTDPSRSISAIRDEMAAAGEGAPEGAISVETTAGEQPDAEAQLQAMMDQPGSQSCENQATSSTARQNDIPESMRIGPLTQQQRARYLLNQMGKGIRRWFSCNWQWLVPSVIGAIVLLVILEIVTGGAVTAALPPLMEIIGQILIGAAIVKTGYYLADYLAKSVAGDVTAAARSLARGLAAGAIELVFALLFNISAIMNSLKQGLRSSLRAAARTLSETAQRTRQAVRTLGETVVLGGRTAAGRRVAGAALRNGRVVMNGADRSIGRGISSLDDLARRLWRRVRFRRFKIRRVTGRRFQLLGYINPWVLLADGSIVEVEQHELPPGVALGDFITVPGLARSGMDPRVVLVGLGQELAHADAQTIIRNITSRNLTRGPNFFEHFDKHRNVLERVTGRRYDLNTHQEDFLNDIQNLIHSGGVQLVGFSTIKKGQPLVAVFRGQGVTVVTHPNGEWVTIWRTGEGSDLNLSDFVRLHVNPPSEIFWWLPMPMIHPISMLNTWKSAQLIDPLRSLVVVNVLCVE